ncbi:MAG: putative ABC transporter permease [Oscillospiraceae bacterium]|jgi:uncharacterized membrane protein|nr:putative ABC transporter permease [Oscillospiraceae bacterium]MCI8715692.1 putative ABC transporter permease [Oscillospiraceae bacterium]MCI9317674.1 putative ABC transporter permease [Oscillospiraceae bacterium]
MEEQKTQISSELEALCAPLPAAAERAGKALEERYYVSLAQAAMEPEDSPTRLGPKALALESEVQAELEGVRQVSRTLVQTYQTLDSAADELSARLRDMRTARERKWYVPNPPANSAIDLAEARRDHFAQGLNIYKVLLICAAGSFAGVVVEMLWCLITNGYLESRAGLVYGPFNLLYGAGAVCLTLALYKYRNRGYQWSFLGGFVVGSVLEYVCSWAQEALLGSRSWDYSGMALNLNGRICLVYSVFWGVLGIFWIKDLYPRMAKYILKIPNRTGRPLTWALTVFLLVNALISCVAVSRWSERVAGEPAGGGFWEFVDQRFPDERMERIFANMEFGPPAGGR